MTQDVVDLIMQDHREVERLFDELRDPKKRAGLLPVLTTLLTAHSRAEEAEVYPVGRDEAGIADDVAHSQEEHVEAEQLLAQLAGIDPESPDFDEHLDRVVAAVSHHVEEEEATVLPGIRNNLPDKRLAELAEAFLATRSEHLGEQPGEARKADLQQQAENIGLSGTSGMSREQLQKQLIKEAEESEE